MHRNRYNSLSKHYKVKTIADFSFLDVYAQTI